MSAFESAVVEISYDEYIHRELEIAVLADTDTTDETQTEAASSGYSNVITAANSINRNMNVTVTFARNTDDNYYVPTAAYIQTWNYNSSTGNNYFSSGTTAHHSLTVSTNGEIAYFNRSSRGFNASNNTIQGEGIIILTLSSGDLSSDNTMLGYCVQRQNEIIVGGGLSSDVDSYFIRPSSSSADGASNSNYVFGFYNTTSSNEELTSNSSDNGKIGVATLLSASNYNATSLQFKDSTYSFSSSSGPNCMDQDTKVLCLDKDLTEKYIEVKNLKPGDIVKTYKRGYKRINKIGYDVSPNDVNTDRLTAARFVLRKTDQNNLTEDLFVSARHLILVDSLTPEQERKEIETFGKVFKVEDKFLVQARHHPDFELVNEHGFYCYFQMTLENDGDEHLRHGIYTNGYLTETTCQRDYETHLKGLRQV